MDRITLKNYRCFHDRQTARLAPLTLLVGENSTGKTSFMALIRVLWDVAYGHRVPDFKKPPYDLGSFDEIVHNRGKGGSRVKVFEAGFDATPRHDMTVEEGNYCFEVTFGENLTAPVITRRRLTCNDAWIEDRVEKTHPRQIRFGTPNGSWRHYTFSDRHVAKDLDYDMIDSFFVLYTHLRSATKNPEDHPDLVPLGDSDLPVEEDMKRIRRIGYLDHFEMPTMGDKPRAYASAPVRSQPLRTYAPSRPTPDPQGDHVPMYLANLYFREQAQWNDLKHALETFGKTSGLFDEISIGPLGKRDSEPFQVQVRKFGGRLKGPRRNLIDMGYGVSQVLPVITELLRRDAPSMFLVQQPEVHLHPSAQAALGSLLCNVASRERQLVIETHSDHLLDRVRMDVRDGAGRLKPEDVSILYFERRDLDVRIHSLRLDEEGNVLGAPDGYRSFFLEETARSLWKRQSAGT